MQLTIPKRPVRSAGQPQNCEIMEPDFSKLIEDTVAYLDKRFENLSKKPLSYFEIFDISQLPHDREALAVYGDKDVKNLVHHFSEVLTEEEIASIPDEWSDLKIWMRAHRGRSHLLDLYSDLVRENPEHLSNILVLVQLLLTLSPSTASCERGFSCMNRVKNSQRTCLQNDVLNDLIQLSADGCEVNEYSPDKALEYWYFSAKGTRHLDHKTPKRKATKQNKEEESQEVFEVDSSSPSEEDTSEEEDNLFQED